MNHTALLTCAAEKITLLKEELLNNIKKRCENEYPGSLFSDNPFSIQKVKGISKFIKTTTTTKNNNKTTTTPNKNKTNRQKTHKTTPTKVLSLCLWSTMTWQKSVMHLSHCLALYWMASNLLVPGANINMVKHILCYLTNYFILTNTDDYSVFNLGKLRHMLNKTMWKFAPQVI